MRGIIAAVLSVAFPGIAGAAPVTYQYSLPCFVECREGWGDHADVSVTFDNAGFGAWGHFGAEALVDFSVTSGPYHAELSDMIGADVIGTWSNLPDSRPSYYIMASQNYYDPANPFPPRLTVNLARPFFGDSISAELGRAGSLSSMGDYATFAQPQPIPLPAPAALLPLALSALAAIGLRRRPAPIAGA